MSTKPKGVHLQQGITYTTPGHISNGSGRLLGELKIKPQGQERLLLGSFTAGSLKGFSVELTPQPDPEDAVVTHIANAGTAEEYKLLLHVINYGAKTVTAKVWQL